MSFNEIAPYPGNSLVLEGDCESPSLSNKSRKIISIEPSEKIDALYEFSLRISLDLSLENDVEKLYDIHSTVVHYCVCHINSIDCVSVFHNCVCNVDTLRCLSHRHHCLCSKNVNKCRKNLFEDHDCQCDEEPSYGCNSHNHMCDITNKVTKDNIKKVKNEIRFMLHNKNMTIDIPNIPRQLEVFIRLFKSGAIQERPSRKIPLSLSGGIARSGDIISYVPRR
jgi:hypothetical protein